MEEEIALAFILKRQPCRCDQVSVCGQHLVAGHNLRRVDIEHHALPRNRGQQIATYDIDQFLYRVMLLRHIEERAAADKLENAISAIVAEGKDVTYDMKPHRDDPTAVGTVEMGDAIIAAMG